MIGIAEKNECGESSCYTYALNIQLSDINPKNKMWDKPIKEIKRVNCAAQNDKLITK